MMRSGPILSRRGAVILAWLLAAGALVALWFGVMGAVGAFYHPYSPQAPYGERLFALAAIGAPAALVAASVISLVAWRTARRLDRAALGLGAALLLWFGGGLATVEPQPATQRRFAGDTAFDVPSGYLVNRRGLVPGDGFPFEACRAELASRYAVAGCDTVRASLASGPSTPLPAAGRAAETPYGTARVVARPGGSPGSYRAVTYLVLDPEGRTTAMAECDSLFCDVEADTPLGRLWFRMGPTPDPAAWAEMEARLLALLEGWRAPE